MARTFAVSIPRREIVRKPISLRPPTPEKWAEQQRILHFARPPKRPLVVAKSETPSVKESPAPSEVADKEGGQGRVEEPSRVIRIRDTMPKIVQTPPVEWELVRREPPWMPRHVKDVQWYLREHDLRVKLDVLELYVKHYLLQPKGLPAELAVRFAIRAPHFPEAGKIAIVRDLEAELRHEVNNLMRKGRWLKTKLAKGELVLQVHAHNREFYFVILPDRPVVVTILNEVRLKHGKGKRVAHQFDRRSRESRSRENRARTF